MACLRLTALLLLATVSVAACTAVGAGTIALDNYAYSDAMGSAVKRQMLLNMMQLRHGEAPVSAKRMFSLLLVLTSLAETGVSPSAPLITVGTRG